VCDCAQESSNALVSSTLYVRIAFLASIGCQEPPKRLWGGSLDPLVSKGAWDEAATLQLVVGNAHCREVNLFNNTRPELIEKHNSPSRRLPMSISDEANRRLNMSLLTSRMNARPRLLLTELCRNLDLRTAVSRRPHAASASRAYFGLILRTDAFVERSVLECLTGETYQRALVSLSPTNAFPVTIVPCLQLCQLYAARPRHSSFCRHPNSCRSFS